MKFSTLATFLEKLEKTSSRLTITDILAELFRRADKSEIDKLTYLILGSLAPAYEMLVFNIAEQMMVVAIAKAFDKDKAEIKKMYKSAGDLGIVTQKLNDKKSTSLSVSEVYQRLCKIAQDEGGGSQERKIDGIAKLLSELDSLSCRFVARIPVGKLRLGFSDKTIIDALSVMKNGDKSERNEIERAYNLRPDIGLLAKEVKEHGLKNLSKRIKPQVGIPVAPMLAQRLKSPEDMITKMEVVSVEPKFDGLRIFIHYQKKGKGSSVQVFTRNMNYIDPEVFPELADIKKCFSTNVQDVVLDSEAVGMDPKRERFVDFQKTIQRRRKHNVTTARETTPLQFQVFDILLLNGKSLLQTPYIKRRETLQKVIKKGNGLLRVDEHKVTSDPDEIRALHKKYLKMGLEGIIVKKADSKYISGRTGWRWVKMKEAEDKLAKLSDTVDCVVMGYTRGKGKRAEFGIGQFLAGIVSGEKFKTVTKVGTGLTDDQFREMKKRLSKLEVKKKPKEFEVHKDLEPDFWVTPKLVVELAADEITKSPKHTAGYALRFPRLVKFRDDKSASQATTLKELKALYKLQ